MMIVFREHICYSIRIDIDFTTFYRLLIFMKKIEIAKVGVPFSPGYPSRF